MYDLWYWRLFDNVMIIWDYHVMVRICGFSFVEIEIVSRAATLARSKRTDGVRWAKHKKRKWEKKKRKVSPRQVLVEARDCWCLPRRATLLELPGIGHGLPEWHHIYICHGWGKCQWCKDPSNTTQRRIQLPSIVPSMVCRWRRRVCDAELGSRMERERSAVKVMSP